LFDAAKRAIFIDIPAWGESPTVALLYALVAVRMIPLLKRAADVLPTGLYCGDQSHNPRFERDQVKRHVVSVPFLLSIVIVLPLPQSVVHPCATIFNRFISVTLPAIAGMQ
jgi:hypothetical protein